MPFLRPGQGFKKFMVKKKKKGLTSSGKPISCGYEDIGHIIGILATANQKEVEHWKQQGHPITHKIVQQGIKNAAVATNYLVLSETGKKDRYFYVQGTGNPGELNHMMRYFVEERQDLKNG
jgi:hypothetical protein